MNIPEDLKYTKTDEWVRVEGDTATIGITDYAQDQLSDIVFVEIQKSVGNNIEQGNGIATVESVKAAADVSSPLSGKVIEVNEKLSQSPDLLNSDPYGQAWLVKIRSSKLDELQNLMDASSYQELKNG